VSVSQISTLTAYLRLPNNEQFQVDGTQIGRTSMALGAKLPRPDPAVILRISHIPETMPSVTEYSKRYQSQASMLV